MSTIQPVQKRLNMNRIHKAHADFPDIKIMHAEEAEKNGKQKSNTLVFRRYGRTALPFDILMFETWLITVTQGLSASEGFPEAPDL